MTDHEAARVLRIVRQFYNIRPRTGYAALFIYAVLWLTAAAFLGGCATAPCDQACHARTAQAARDAADMVQHRVDHMDYPAAVDCAFDPRGCR